MQKNNTRRIAATRAGGFTLIELMITVAIIGLLAGIAIPSYNSSVLRGKRSEGRTALVDLAAREERFYSDNNQYTDTLGAGGLGYTGPACGADQSETCKYTLTIDDVTGTNQTFTLIAAPTFADSDCGNLTLTQTGAKDVTGSGSADSCWGR